DDAVSSALTVGAKAFVLKTVRGTEIADVVHAVAAGRTLLDERTLTRYQSGSDPTAELTKSELRVLDLIGEGLSNREIAERLGVAEKTVKNHVTSLLAKMGLQRRTQVAACVASNRGGRWRPHRNGTSRDRHDPTANRRRGTPAHRPGGTRHARLDAIRRRPRGGGPRRARQGRELGRGGAGRARPRNGTRPHP